MTSKNSPDPKGYWKANLRAVFLLLAVWFFAGCVLSILVVEPLNAFHVGGFPVGFWFAQQGAIYVFILLILIYAKWMDKIDQRFDVQKEQKP